MSVRLKDIPLASGLDFLPEERYAVARGPPEGEQGTILLVVEVQPMLSVVEDEHA